MTRPWHVWLGFAACVAVLLAAMAWLSRTALNLERAEAKVRRQAEVEESVRLALWRMDSALTPLIAEEGTRPYFAYQPLYAPLHSYTRTYDENPTGSILVPSPLLVSDSPYVRLHFQVGPDGSVTSPQVPADDVRALISRFGVSTERVSSSQSRLADFRARTDREQILAAMPESRATTLAMTTPPEPMNEPAQPPMGGARQLVEAQQARQRQLNVREQRARAVQQAENVVNVDVATVPTPSEVTTGESRAFWLGDLLLLARHVSIGGRAYIQGCWLDWPAINSRLLDEVSDLLPQARLVPVRTAPSATETRMLAALPARLIPGEVPGPGDEAVSPVRGCLLIAWIGVLLAAAAVAMLLSGTIALSERRAAFVSAVTHEMRTPLTTFRMYTEMLIKDMVADEAKRRRYLATLGKEAQRLSHLVENVLAYARLERGRRDDRRGSATVAELIGRVRERLSRRAEQADMRLVLEDAGEVLDRPIHVDAEAAEQILFNLVDNACKYAASADDRRIHLHVVATGQRIALRIRDHGPGIPAAYRHRLFRPFSKSAQEAAHSAPGVGLGLALSRRLARNMNGELALDRNVAHGACFVLTLPLA